MTGVACAQMKAAQWRSVLLLQVGKKAANEPPRVFYGAYRGAAINIGTVAIIRDTCAHLSLRCIHAHTCLAPSFCSHACTGPDAHACALKSAVCTNRVWFLVVIGTPLRSALRSITTERFGQSFYLLPYGDKKKTLTKS